MRTRSMILAVTLLTAPIAVAQKPPFKGGLRFSHEQPVVGVAFSPDGKSLLGESPDSLASVIWDADSGKLVSQFRGKALARGLAFSSDGRWLIDHKMDGTARLWDFATGEVARAWGKESIPKSKEAFVASLAYFVRDGKILVIHGKQQDAWLIRRFNLDMGTELRPHEVSDDNGFNSTISPDGKMMVQRNGTDTPLFLLDLDTGKKLHSFEKSSDSLLLDVAFSPDGKTLAGVQNQAKVMIWEATTGKLLRQFENVRTGFFGIRRDPFSPDGKLLAVNDGKDRKVLIYDLTSGKLLHSVSNGNGEHCYSLFSPNSRLLATQSDGVRTICIWDVASGKKLATFAFELGQLTSESMAFSPDSKSLAFVSGETIKLLEVKP